MRQELSHRLAQQSEIDLILEIEQRAGVRFDQLMEQDPAFASLIVPPDPTPKDELNRAISHQLCWIAESSGVAAGFLYSSTTPSSLFLEELDVLPEFGRRGIGTYLLEVASDRALELRLETLSLCTYRNVPWNGPFYARRGFREAVDPSEEFIAIVRDEVRRGFDLDQRVLMVRLLLGCRGGSGTGSVARP